VFILLVVARITNPAVHLAPERRAVIPLQAVIGLVIIPNVMVWDIVVAVGIAIGAAMAINQELALAVSVLALALA